MNIGVPKLEEGVAISQEKKKNLIYLPISPIGVGFIMGFMLELSLINWLLNFCTSRLEGVFDRCCKSINRSMDLLVRLLSFIEAFLIGHVSNIDQDAPFVVENNFISLKAYYPVVLITIFTTDC